MISRIKLSHPTRSYLPNGGSPSPQKPLPTVRLTMSIDTLDQWAQIKRRLCVCATIKLYKRTKRRRPGGGGRATERRVRGVEARGGWVSELVQARYEPGFYQIISCHTDDDAAGEPTSGLAFPVNAAANQAQPRPSPFPFHPFILCVSSISSSRFVFPRHGAPLFRPVSRLFAVQPLRSVSSCSSTPYPPPLPTSRPPLKSSSLVVRFAGSVPRQRCLFRFLNAHTEGSNDLLAGRFAAAELWGFAYEEFIIGYCLSCTGRAAAILAAPAVTRTRRRGAVLLRWLRSLARCPCRRGIDGTVNSGRWKKPCGERDAVFSW